MAAAPAPPDALRFVASAYSTLHVTVDGAPMELRRYKVVYVANPVKMAATQPVRVMGPPVPAADNGAADPWAYQSMFIYVPQAAYADTRTAIVLRVNNGGWFASPVADRISDGQALAGNSDRDPLGAALKAGYVVVSAGTRSRGILGADGSWVGKSPAVIVDAKAAIRYLRLNDAAMPGSAERIVITGTSGGGGLSVAVAASGNSPDYFPALAAIGAAGIDARGRSTIRDDVFATIAYCPITDLGHSDIAYEWQYGALRSLANVQGGQYPAAMQSASSALAAAYPAYLASLRLKLEDGTPLTAATMGGAIVAQVKRSVEAAIAQGVQVPAFGEDFVVASRGGTVRRRNDWLTVENGKVRTIDYPRYLDFVAATTPLKIVPAFDPNANSGNRGVAGESSLFGAADREYSNFAEYSWNHNEVKGDGSGADDTGMDWARYVAGPGKGLAGQVRMAAPFAYLGTAADAAPYWYVRHGTLDRDTAFAIEVALYHAIRSDRSVKDVNFQLAWMQPHAGDYDVTEAYAWLASVLARSGH